MECQQTRIRSCLVAAILETAKFPKDTKTFRSKYIADVLRRDVENNGLVFWINNNSLLVIPRSFDFWQANMDTKAPTKQILLPL